MSNVLGWLTVGAGGVVMQTQGCSQELGTLLAESLSQLISGIVATIITEFVNGLFNLPPTLSF